MSGLDDVSDPDDAVCYPASELRSDTRQLMSIPYWSTVISRPWKSHDAVIWNAMFVNTTTYSQSANNEYTKHKTYI